MATVKIKLTACKHDNVKAQLGLLKLDTEGSLKQCVDRLKGWYHDHENDKGMEMAGCDVCGADSDAQLDACPFCGEGGVMDNGVLVGSDKPTSNASTKKTIKSTTPGDKAAAAKAEKEKKVAAIRRRGTEAKDADKPKPTSKSTPKPKAPPKKKKTPKTKSADAKAAKAPKSKPPIKKKKASKSKPPPKPNPKAAPSKTAPSKSKAPKSKAAPKPKVPTKPKAAPPKPDAAVSTSLVTVKHLDDQITIIRDEVQKGALAMHTIGHAFKEIRDSHSWKMRLAKGDVSRYSSFGQFCIEELGASKQHVYRQISIAEQFTPKQVADLSGNQIRAVQLLSPDSKKRSATLAANKAAKDGEGTSSLSQRAAGLQNDKATPKPIPTKAVTVAMAMGITKVPMYQRPKKGAKLDTETAKRATSMADKPWLYLELTNGVHLIVRIVPDKNGELQGTVEFRRGEPVL